MENATDWMEAGVYELVCLDDDCYRRAVVRVGLSCSRKWVGILMNISILPQSS